MRTINDELKAHPFFEGFEEDEINLIAGCGQHEIFKKDQIIANEQDNADWFYLIKQGLIGVSMSFPDRTNQMLQTLGDNEMFGWSWLFPPYKWTVQAKAIETTHTIALHGKCLREKLEDNPALGYKLMKRFSLLITRRLNASRLQMLDVYGVKHP